MEDSEKDNRFSHVVRDVKFKRIPKKHVKVKVDKRFRSMLTDKKFQIKKTMDKRGRPLGMRDNEDFVRFFHTSGSSSESEETETRSNKDQDSEDDVLSDGGVKDENRQRFVQKDTDGTCSSRKKPNNGDIEESKSVKRDKTNESKFAKVKKDNAKIKEKTGDESMPKKSIPKFSSSGDTTDDQDDENINENKSPDSDACEYGYSSLELSSDDSEDNDKIKEDGLVSSENKKKKSQMKERIRAFQKNLRSGRDRARGKGRLTPDEISSSDEDEESSDDEGVESDEEVHDWGELDHDAERTDEATSRLAVCRMDWDRIKAVDLMVLFSSFLPTGGVIKSISIYPSEYGLKRMKEEEEKGPAEFKEFKVENEDDNTLNKQHIEKLRKYQLNRLNYYYAVVVCDAPGTADALYKECDGLEYESSAVKLDLRFIPEDMSFTEEPKDTCTELPDPATYKPNLFQTTALTSSKVDLTWDQNDPDREDFVKSLRNGNVDEGQLEKYVAFSSDSDEDIENSENDNLNEREETEESTVGKFKALLSEIEMKEKEKKKNDDLNMEVTWDINLENKAKEDIMKKQDNITPFEEYLQKNKEKKKKKKQKKKEKKTLMNEEQKRNYEQAFSDDDIPSDVDLNDPYFKEELDKLKPKKSKKMRKLEDEESKTETEEAIKKKAELELLLLDDKTFGNVDNMQENEITEDKKKNKKKRRKSKKCENSQDKDDFKVNVNDERFSALYSSHHFNIDPTDPHYNPTKGTLALIEEKMRRRAMEENPKKLQPQQKKK